MEYPEAMVTISLKEYRDLQKASVAFERGNFNSTLKVGQKIKIQNPNLQWVRLSVSGVDNTKEEGVVYRLNSMQGAFILLIQKEDNISGNR